MCTIEVFHSSEVEENLRAGWYWRIGAESNPLRDRPGSSVGPFASEIEAEADARQEETQ